MLRLSTVLPVFLSTLTLGTAAGCGGSGATDDATATPAEAVVEIRRIETLLATAIDQVRAGDADSAEKTVGNAYLEHFEHVEQPLGERDHELMERLEEAISTELRNEIKAGKSAEEIKLEVDRIKADLERAVELLQR